MHYLHNFYCTVFFLLLSFLFPFVILFPLFSFIKAKQIKKNKPPPQHGVHHESPLSPLIFNWC